MTTITNVPGSIYPRLADTGGRIPFGLIDANNSGKVSKSELHIALQRIFPSLSDKQCQAIADGAFSTLRGQGMTMDRNGWAVAEETVLQSAKALDQSNAIQTGSAPSGWLNATGLAPNAPVMIGQNQIPLPPNMLPGGGYMPRNDFAVTGYNPYQYPMGMPPLLPNLPGLDTPGQKMAKGAGRGLLGFLKMIPIVGNIINGIDFIKDIPKAFSTFGNPTKTFGEKLKAGADLLFHGAGMLIPQVGAGYDMAQGAVRVAAGGIEAMSRPGMGYSPWNQLPPYQFNSAGISPMYNMQYGSSPYQPSAYNPGYNQFANYSQYPSYPLSQSFMPSWGQQMYQPSSYPMLPYGTNPMQYGMQIPSYDMYSGSPYGYQYNPYQQRLGTPQDAMAGMARSGIGALKMTPGLGNIINGIDFVRDIGQMARGEQPLKNAADLLFHGIGMVLPQVGGAYDMVQGGVRAAAGGMGMGGYGMGGYGYGGGYGYSLPAFNYGGYGYQPSLTW